MTKVCSKRPSQVSSSMTGFEKPERITNYSEKPEGITNSFEKTE